LIAAIGANLMAAFFFDLLDFLAAGTL